MNTTELRNLLKKATPRPWSLAPGRILTGAEYERIIHRDHIHCDSDAALIVALVNNAEALLNVVEAAALYRSGHHPWCNASHTAKPCNCGCHQISDALVKWEAGE